MCYKILANKWRPKIFSDVVGQENIIKSLTNSLHNKHIHHAYIFSGPKGVGKTTIARLLAKGLNCKKNISTGIPCGMCNHCIEIEQNRFIDLIEIDAASRTKVEDMRELLDTIQYLPTKGFYKIYLIDEAHMLSKHSFNALLKTLEEPPQHVKFFLATTELHKLPTTITSRCFQLNLKKIKTNLIIDRLIFILNKENITAENKAVELLADNAHGSMRDALTLTDQVIAINRQIINIESIKSVISLFDKNQVLDLFECIINDDSEELMNVINQLATNNIDWDDLLIEILKILHHISLLQLVKKTKIKNNMSEISYENRLLNFAYKLPIEDVQLYYQIFITGRKELHLAPNTRMGLEMTLLRALAFYPHDLELKKNTTERTESSLQQNNFEKLHKLLEVKLKKKTINTNDNKKIVDEQNSITYDINHIFKKIKNSNTNNVLEIKKILQDHYFITITKLFDAEIYEQNVI